ncbi:MAG: cytochrome c [Verrucomicrobia bacterium]|nr:cytochrome c [Verrucomicrobiota bacterium]
MHHPLLAAVLAVALALVGTAMLATTVRHSAAAVSHELPESTRALLTAGQITPQLVRNGEKYYFNSCAHCHGTDARGDEGPDLHGLEISDRRIATVIKHGIKGEMPSFAKKHDDADIVAMIAYLRTLK